MIKTTCAATVAALLIFTAPAFAQFTYTPKSSEDIGLYLGGQIWQSAASGIYGEEKHLIDFNLKKQQQMHYFLAVRHPVSFLPHARISTTTLDSAGKTTLTQAFDFGTQTFALGSHLETNFNVNYVDYTLYYDLFDNEKFSFELGVTARDLNADVIVSGPTTSPDDTCNEPNPTPGSPCAATGNTSTAMSKIKTSDMTPTFEMSHSK